MNPDATLKKMRAIEGQDPRELDPEDLFDLLLLFGKLDEWLSNGGALPSAWSKR